MNNKILRLMVEYNKIKNKIKYKKTETIFGKIIYYDCFMKQDINNIKKKEYFHEIHYNYLSNDISFYLFEYDTRYSKNINFYEKHTLLYKNNNYILSENMSYFKKILLIPELINIIKFYI